MPTKQVSVKAEKFLSSKGVTVYRTYKHDDVDNGPDRYGFCLDAYDSDVGYFDVRTLDVSNKSLLSAHPPYLVNTDPVYFAADAKTRKQYEADWAVWHDKGEVAAIKAIIRQAINAGVITAVEDDEY